MPCRDPAAYIKPWPLQTSIEFIQRKNHKDLAKGQWHEIFKKLNKLTLCAGRFPNKQSHVQVNQAHESCEKNCFTDVKTTQTKFL
jgi:hypothetical protein